MYGEQHVYSKVSPLPNVIVKLQHLADLVNYSMVDNEANTEYPV